MDFAWPELGVFLEFDGTAEVPRVRATASRSTQVLREKRREELICELTGWVCIRITWADLAPPGTAAPARSAQSSTRAVQRGLSRPTLSGYF